MSPSPHIYQDLYASTRSDPLTSTSIPVQTETLTKTMLTPATSSEIRDAIEALLMLGDRSITDKTQSPEDDNALLVPISGTGLPPNNYAPAKPVVPLGEQLEDTATEQTEESANPEKPKPNEDTMDNDVNTETLPEDTFTWNCSRLSHQNRC